MTTELERLNKIANAVEVIDNNTKMSLYEKHILKLLLVNSRYGVGDVKDR